MTKKLILLPLIIITCLVSIQADTNTDIRGMVILKKNFRIYFDRGRSDGVAIGQKLYLISKGEVYDSAQVSWIAEDIAYTALDSVAFYRLYYVDSLGVNVYLENPSMFIGGAVHVPYFSELSLKPNRITAPEEYAVGYLIYDNLVRMGEDGKIEPGLAQMWEVNGNICTFYLRQDIKFHSGKYLEALDVAHTFVELAKAPTLTPATSFIMQIEGFDDVRSGKQNEFSGISILNKYTIAIKTRDVFSPLLAYLTGPGGFIIPAIDQTVVPIGTGPFKVTSINRSQIALIRNEQYYEAASLLDSIIFDYYSSYKDAALDFEMGHLDLLYFDSQNDDDLLSGDYYQSRQYHTNSLVMLAVNCARDSYNNIELAKALGTLFDRESIVRVLLGNSGRATASLTNFSLGMPSLYAGNMTFTPEEATQQLSLLVNLPQPLNLLYDENDPALKSVADYIAGQIRHAGLMVNITSAKAEQINKSAFADSIDIYLFRYNLPTLDPDALFYPIFANCLYGHTNYLYYDNLQLQRYLDIARTLDDKYARQDIYQLAEESIMQSPPVIVLYNPYMTVACRRDLAGFEADPRAFINLRDAYYQMGK